MFETLGIAATVPTEGYTPGADVVIPNGAILGRGASVGSGARKNQEFRYLK